MSVSAIPRISVACFAFGLALLVQGDLIAQDSRAVQFFNSTEDVTKVRIHCLHFDGRVFFKEVAKDGEALQPNVGLGERAIVVYRMNGKVLTTGKLPLQAGNGPARVGVFGNEADGYRIDVGL